MDINKFKEVTQKVIDTLEGGYWNPAWHGIPKGYEKSGETLYGIDRRAGGVNNATPSGIKFWNAVDKAKSPAIWRMYYIPSEPLRSELLNLASEMQFPLYVKYSDKYLTDVKTRAIVENDPRLVFHFSYATWNGEGWFHRFANDITKAVKDGITDADALVKVALNSRTNSGSDLIAKGGNKMKGFIDTLKENIVATATEVKEKTKEEAQTHPIRSTAIVIGVALLVIILVRTVKRNW